MQPLSGFHRAGTNVKIYDWAKILSPETVTLGSDIIIDDFVFLGSHHRLIIGNHVHIASHASISGGGDVLIGDFAGISSGARLISGTDDFTDGALTGPTLPPAFRSVRRGRIVLGPHVVVGSNAVVLPDVTIGEGSTVGAGAVVTRDLDAWGIYVGAPARKVKTRPRELLLSNEQRLFEQYGCSTPQYRSATCLDEP
jgi:galactoside O-acetyltransferase